jgi:N-acetylglucosamine kinase-like BadF-type ATPase
MCSLFLGVDGGGTKTGFVIVNGGGKRVASSAGPSSYHPQVGIDGVREVLNGGLTSLFGQAGIDGAAITYAFFGLPAYGEDSDAQVLLDALPATLLGHRRYSCGNDMICAWAGSLGGADGINIVAGTGSIGYGERRGRTARAGGWGELFGDEGSAYWLAVQGLNTFTRMSDGRLPKGPLYAVFKASLGLREDLDLFAKLMHAHAREDIAALSQLVARAAHDGDSCAVHIFERAAQELAAIIVAVRQALEFGRDEPVPLSYSGGLFNAGPPILDPLKRELKHRSGDYRLQPPMFTPSIGAAIYAARLAGQPLSDAALRLLHHSQ